MVASSAPKPTYTTTGTVSNPLDLDNPSYPSSSALQPKGEHESVQINGNGGSSKRKMIKPKPKVTLTSLTINNTGTLRKINSIVIPIVYSDKFYKDVLDPSLDDLNKLIYYGDIPVGACCCRVDNLISKDKTNPPTLVILTLAILAPYRSLGLGSALIHQSLKAAIHPTTPPPPTPSTTGTNTRSSLTVAPLRKVINRAMVHVQVGNEGAKRFYGRFGFKEVEVVENYYSTMEPRAATLMVLEDISGSLEGGINGSS